MIDRDEALALLAEPGWRLLVDAGIAFDDACGDADAAAGELLARRPDAEPARRSAALALVAGGARLARHLGLDERLLAVDAAVADASAGRVATWHAQQLASDARVLEIGCGCGADSLAIAHRAANLIAADDDAVHVACVHVNLTMTGVANARAVRGDGFAMLDGEARRADVVFVHACTARDLERAREIAGGPRRVLVRVAPPVDVRADAGFRVAFVMHRGVHVETFLDSRTGDGPRVVTVRLPDDGVSVEMPGDRRGEGAAAR